MGMLMRYLIDVKKTLKERVVDPAWLEQRLSNMMEEEWNAIIDHIFGRIHQSELTIWDEVWSNEVYFCRNVEVYLLLDHAIRNADLGLLRRALGECTILLHAPQGGKTRYARELLRFIHLVDSDAATPELQNAILANCLDNLRRRSDSHMAKDLLLELQNGAMKEEKRARESSTKIIEVLLDQASLNHKTMQGIKGAMESLVGARISNSKHSVKVSKGDILLLAQDLAFRTLTQRTNGMSERFTLYPTVDLYHHGEIKLYTELASYRNKTEDVFDIDLMGQLENGRSISHTSIPLASTSKADLLQPPSADDGF